MTGIKHFSQIDMQAPPTEDGHLVRMLDMQDALKGLGSDGGGKLIGIIQSECLH